MISTVLWHSHESNHIASARLPSSVMYVKIHDDVIKWKPFPRYWPFVQGIHWSPVNSPHKIQWREALILTIARPEIWDAIAPIMTSLWCIRLKLLPHFPGANVLTFFSPGLTATCSMLIAQRVNCGWEGISYDECTSIGCCFDSSVSNVPWCFYKYGKYDDACDEALFALVCCGLICYFIWYIDDLVQDCNISTADALEILQSCTKPSICTYIFLNFSLGKSCDCTSANQMNLNEYGIIQRMSLKWYSIYDFKWYSVHEIQTLY